MPDIKEIITNHLTENDYEGLYNPNPILECGCLIGDLFPCKEVDGKVVCREK